MPADRDEIDGAAYVDDGERVAQVRRYGASYVPIAEAELTAIVLAPALQRAALESRSTWCALLAFDGG